MTRSARQKIVWTVSALLVLAKKKIYRLKRTIMWRPFIIDLRDTRLVKNVPRELIFSWKRNAVPAGGKLAITVRYHLLDESRRKRIGYQNSTPISYHVFQKDIMLLETGDRTK